MAIEYTGNLTVNDSNMQINISAFKDYSVYGYGVTTSQIHYSDKNIVN